MKLIIGNKNYSSWSLRAWLAAKQSGLAFEEIIVPLYGEGWESAKQDDSGLQASSGKVPLLWDVETVVWDSIAILDYLADKVGRERFWPKEDAARGMARSMVAEMHSGYHTMRSEFPMNIRKRFEGVQPSETTKQEVVGGPFLFGTFGAADIFYAPVVSRFISYGVAVPGFAGAYMEAVWEHDWMQAWIEASENEEWVIEQYDSAPALG